MSNLQEKILTEVGWELAYGMKRIWNISSDNSETLKTVRDGIHKIANALGQNLFMTLDFGQDRYMIIVDSNITSVYVLHRQNDKWNFTKVIDDLKSIYLHEERQ